MTSNVAQRLLREPQEPRRVVYLELFFDLAFLLALTRLSRNLTTHLDASGAFHTLLLLAAVYWVWLATTWAADWYDPNHRILQAVIAGSMFGGLLMAAAVPGAIGRYALVFAGAYVAVQVGRGTVLLTVLRGHPLQRRSLRILLWFLLTGVLWVTGAAVRRAQVPLWTVAVVVDFAVGRFGWPTPWLGRTTREDVQASGGRLAERFQQIFIISVGELILVAGMSYSAAGLGRAASVAFTLVFVNAALLALIYYTPAGQQLGPAIDRSEYPASVGQEAGYLHLVLIAAVIASAVADERIITDAGGRAGRDRHGSRRHHGYRPVPLRPDPAVGADLRPPVPGPARRARGDHRADAGGVPAPVARGRRGRRPRAARHGGERLPAGAPRGKVNASCCRLRRRRRRGAGHSADMPGAMPDKPDSADIPTLEGIRAVRLTAEPSGRYL
jgi:low temperature requirement protein LtrA